MGYLAKRTAQALFTIWAVLTISFGLVRFMPGGPLDFVRARLMQGMSNPTKQQRERINTLVEVYTNVRPDAPLYVQYYEYMVKVLQGDLGQSMWYSEPVMVKLGPAIPWTIFLGTVSLIISFSTGIILGAAMAYFEGSNFDISMTTLVTWLHGIPYYVVAIALVYTLGYNMEWFPTSGRSDPNATPGFNWPFIAGVLYYAALPLFSTIVTGIGGGALGMRGNSIQVLGKDYIRVARLRGLPSHRIATRYVARNAILPLYTFMMISIGFMFGGSIILETVFGYPGVGYYMWRAINARDYPLMMGGFILITIAVVVSIFIADLTYGLLDPRVTKGDQDAY
jgi:peptide/nickel transport system permease protein